MAIAGRVAIVPKGDWSADATYKRLDAVTYNNTLYFAKKDVPAGTITSNAEYWSKSIVGGVGTIAKPEEAGIVKPDGKSMSVDESGTLSINLDGTTITLDEAKNVIKLADTLKDAINGALPAANVANNQITTVEGFALDARQANPNLDGTLAKQISDLNGSLNGAKILTKWVEQNGSPNQLPAPAFAGLLIAGRYNICGVYVFSNGMTTPMEIKSNPNITVSIKENNIVIENVSSTNQKCIYLYA